MVSPEPADAGSFHLRMSQTKPIANKPEARRRGNPAWTKGTSGNPAGRPKADRDFRAKCREAMERKGGGWDTAIEFLNSGNFKAVAWAIEFLASYGYGKPRQYVELSGDQSAPVKVQLVEVVRNDGGAAN